MKKMHHPCLKIFLGFGAFFILNVLQLYHLKAQERCASTQILKDREKNNPQLNTHQFEEWINNHQKTIGKTDRNNQKTILTVPVVFHIIHKGEPIGLGTNLLKSRIDRQLEILNEDFNRLNEDADQTLSQFRNVAASLEIEFVYALQDPDGFETSGIVRVPGSQTNYSYSERQILSSESYWPAEDYINIWVADLSNTLGWAEFPVSNLSGLEEASNNRLVDGISIDYLFLGENPDTGANNFESKGRTATHEMGHFFGLRHIWGDGGCSVDDFCEDTPTAGVFTTGCNLTKTTCESLDMVQNFMDYTDDVCMNLFTVDQKSRVRTVIENSPRRASLTQSIGLQEPPVYDRDLGLSSSNSQFLSSCNGDFSPQITIKNQGLLPVEGYEIQLTVNGIGVETLSTTDTLESEEEIVVPFSILNFDLEGQYEIAYQVNLQGSLLDERIENNTKTEFYQKLQSADLPYKKTFKDDLDPWLIRNADGEETWQFFNVGIGVPFQENRQNFGQREELISPIFDFTTIGVPELSLVFAQMEDSIPNKVSIYASYDCGRTFNDLIFTNTAQDLATAYPTDTIFIPQHRLDWDTLNIDLNRLKNEESVCFSIVAENRLSNNFYLDQFQVNESTKKDREIELIKWNDVNPLLCDENIEGSLRVKNTGRESISNYKLQIFNNNAFVKEYIFNSEVLIPGQSTNVSIELPKPQSNSGKLELRATTLAAGEETVSTLFLPFESNCEQELPPLRLSLENNNNDNWFDFNPNQDVGWTFSSTELAVMSNSPQVVKEDSEDWLVSPLLDVSNTNYLGLIFDVAYRKALRQSEKFEIYISDENGKKFNSLIYSKRGDSLATSFGNDVPEELVWRNEFVDLSPYLFREKIRLAFKVTHDNGQNLYLKNITFFVGQSPPPPYPNTAKPYVIYPNPATDELNLHLNLPIAEKGFFQILDMRGKVMLEFQEPKVLNQFATFDVSSLAAGPYLLRLRTDRLTTTQRFIIQR